MRGREGFFFLLFGFYFLPYQQTRTLQGTLKLKRNLKYKNNETIFEKNALNFFFSLTMTTVELARDINFLS